MNWWAVATAALGDGYSGAVSEFGSGVVDVLLCGHARGPGVTGRHARSRGGLARGGEWFARGVGLPSLCFVCLSF